MNSTEEARTSDRSPSPSPIVCLGELLIDFVSVRTGARLTAAPMFARAAGGAPANVAVAVARLGAPAAFIAKASRDQFGDFLVDTLRRERVDIHGIVRDGTAPTGLAFVILSRSGERDFLFYRDGCADTRLAARELPQAFLRRARIFHFGSVSLIQEPSRSATLRAVSVARESGALVSYDPNLRQPLWRSEKMARRWILEGLKLADIAKISDCELRFLACDADIGMAIRRIWRPQLQLLVVSRGRHGCCFRTNSCQGSVPAFQVRAVDTTGAGDAFVAGLLTQLRGFPTGRPISHLSVDELRSSCIFANACGALATLKRGAIPALPTRHQVMHFLRQHGVNHGICVNEA